MFENLLNGFADEMEKIAWKRRLAVPRRNKMDGSGKGKGMPGGLRRNKMKDPCPDKGPGKGKGKGQGKGKNR